MFFHAKWIQSHVHLFSPGIYPRDPLCFHFAFENVCVEKTAKNYDLEIMMHHNFRIMDHNFQIMNQNFDEKRKVGKIDVQIAKNH